MPEFTEINISRAIIDAYHRRLSEAVERDALIVPIISLRGKVVV